ncbi:unnamed protein product [Mucor hiemalis]
MSHFTFPRTGRAVPRELMNSVVLDDNILEDGTNSLISTGSGEGESSSSNSVCTADSSDSSTILAPRPRQPVTTEEPRCWICFGDSSDSQGKWVKPCKCSLEAHQSCLLDWIAENQKASPTKKVNCPQCATPYHLAQSNNLTLALLTLTDSLVRTSTPYVIVLSLGCSLLITCTTYGAFSVMTLLGPRDGERLIGNPSYWTYRQWVGLPLIPILLISTKTRWGDAILPVAAVSILRATGHTPQNIRLTWPMSPALTLSVMPWVRLFYKNVYRAAQRYMTKNLSLQPEQTTPSSRLNSIIDAGRGGSIAGISDRERTLEIDMINGREANGAGVSLINALLWPVISSGVGR